MRDPGNEVVGTAVKRRTCTQGRILASHVKIFHKISKVSISYSRCHAKYAKTHHLGIKTQMFNHCVYCANDQIKVSEWHFYPVPFTDFTGKQVDLTFKFVDENLLCDHSNESFLVVISFIPSYEAVLSDSYFNFVYDTLSETTQ